MILRFTFLLFAFAFMSDANAQMIEDPTTWTYEAKKTGAGEYDLIFHLSLKKEWHIWSMNPGGDGYQIVPSFTFKKNAAVQVIGKVIEKGKPITVVMDGIDGKVTYFSGMVDYVQHVKAKGGLKINGEHEYQVCNDKMCLPPKTKSFTFTVMP